MYLENDEKISDEELFKQPPAEDCPICFLLLPTLDTGRKYYACCGKEICCGCVYAPVYDNQGRIVKRTCPFCRAPMPISDEGVVERFKKRIEADDPIAICNQGRQYASGLDGFKQDYT